MSTILTSLLAVTALTVAAPQAQAQRHPDEPAGVPVTKLVNPPIHVGTPSDLTPQEVLTGKAIRLGTLEPTQKLRVVVGLTPPHMAEEEKFVADVQTKGSPNFHKFLTAEEWNARFAPSAADEQKVVDWLRSQGLDVNGRYSNRLVVDAEGTADVVAKAFNVQLNRYQVGPDVEYSNDRDPFIPASLEGIIHSVGGLNSIQRLHSPHEGSSHPGAIYSPMSTAPSARLQQNGDRKLFEAAMKAAAERAAGGGDKTLKLKGGTEPGAGPTAGMTNGYIDPTDIYSYYGYDFNALQAEGHCCNPAHLGSGSPAQTSIAIATSGDFSNSDLTGFQAQYPYLAYDVSRIYLDGTPSCCNDETTLDLEWALATANSFGSYLDTSHVYVYAGSNAAFSTFTDVYNKILSDNVTRIFSTSWGCAENSCTPGSTMDTDHAIFVAMVGQGWTVNALSHDHGATAGCDDANSVSYPGSDPSAVSVGGTALALFSDGTFSSEHAWSGGHYSGACGSNGGGSGGGCSAHFAAPSNQGTTGFCGSGSRTLPDISLNAAYGQNYYFNGALGGVGGTSISTPQVAGFMAQENAYLLALGNGPMGNAAYPIWYLANNPNYAIHKPFYDIVGGNNSNDITDLYSNLTYYNAVNGFDRVTGWGAFNALQMAWAINAYYVDRFANPTVSFSGPAVTIGADNWFNTDQTIGWTVTANATYSTPVGVAGYSWLWDDYFTDSTSVAGQPTSATSDLFYNGPSVKNASTGSVLLSSAGQGCHFLDVYGFDNVGRVTGANYDYYLCYDSVAPTIAVSNSPAPNSSGWWNTNVQVTLTPSDATPGSGVKATYYASDTGACYSGALGPCTTYSGPFTYSAEGQNYIYYFTQDNAGNFSAEPYEYLYIDKTAPTTASSLSGTVYSGNIYTTPVQVTLTPSDVNGSLVVSGVKTTFYKLDGGASIHYTGPFTVGTLGSHTIVFSSTDYAGNAEHNKTVTFSVKGTPGITWGTPAAIAYLTPLSATQLNATSGIAGTFAYSPAAGTVLHAGWTTITATFTPTDPTKYISVSTTRGQLVNKATPVLHWGTPAAITYGTKLSATQLDATANTSGTFVYSPASGALLPGGWTTITATFHPSDTADFVSTSTTRGQFVNKTTANIIWNNPAPITHGTALSATQLNAVVHGVNGGVLAGTSTYAPPAGTILAVGTHTLKITFAPTDTTDYLTTTKTV
ncbi:MAG TPA: protease pro-enzyme activation domain-containing protein, partial [Terracidiphilus sp.]